jgi:hypothetical protein
MRGMSKYRLSRHVEEGVLAVLFCEVVELDRVANFSWNKARELTDGWEEF